jgi:hypothetical protein
MLYLSVDLQPIVIADEAPVVQAFYFSDTLKKQTRRARVYLLRSSSLEIYMSILPIGSGGRLP